MEVLRTSFARFPWRLYLTLICRLLFPTIYTTFRTSLLASLGDASVLSIATQMAWISVLLEIVEEGLLLPLYHCLGESIGDLAATRNKVKSGFLMSVAIYTTFSVTISAACSWLVTWMGQDDDLHDDTVHYIRLELIGIVMSSLGKFLMLVMVMEQWNKMLFTMLLVQMTTSVILDVTLVSEKVLNLGTNGVAYSSIGTSTLVLVAAIIICWKKLHMDCHIIFQQQYDFQWFRKWTKVGFYSALDSLIRNAVYLIVVLRAMNLLDEQDSYWLTNTFIWSWLLLPALPLADVLKQDVGDTSHGQIPHLLKTSAYFALATIIVIVWFVLYPAWEPFVRSVLNAGEHTAQVIQLCHILIPCYICLVFGSLLNSVFYGLGKTQYLALSSFIGNIYQVSLFLFMIYGIFPNEIYVVAGIFGSGLVVGAVIKTAMYAYVMRRRSLL